MKPNHNAQSPARPNSLHCKKKSPLSHCQSPQPRVPPTQMRTELRPPTLASGALLHQPAPHEPLPAHCSQLGAPGPRRLRGAGEGAQGGTQARGAGPGGRGRRHSHAISCLTAVFFIFRFFSFLIFCCFVRPLPTPRKLNVTTRRDATIPFFALPPHLHSGPLRPLKLQQASP